MKAHCSLLMEWYTGLGTSAPSVGQEGYVPQGTQTQCGFPTSPHTQCGSTTRHPELLSVEGRSPPLNREAQQPQRNAPKGPQSGCCWAGLEHQVPSDTLEEGTESAQHPLPRKNECLSSRMARASALRIHLYLHPTRTLGEPLAPGKLEGPPIWEDAMHEGA